MDSEEYGGLLETVQYNLKQTLEMKNFNFGMFLQEMEDEFTCAGFREKQARGGVENILILRLDAVGDFILTSPAIRTVRENYPSAYITLVVSETVYPLAEFCPYVNEVLPFNRNFDHGNILEVIYKSTEFAAKYLWKRKYQIGFAFKSWFRMLDVFMLYLSGARFRVGQMLESHLQYTNNLLPPEQNLSAYFLTHPFLYPKENIHDVTRNLYVLKAFGLQIRRTDCEVWYTAEDVQTAKKLLAGFAPDRIKIVTAIGAAGQIEKRYPVEQYLAAFKKIIDKGAALIIIGGPVERGGAEFLEKNLPEDSVINFVKRGINLRISSAIINQSDMYIGNDTGPKHIAAALKKPVIAVIREAKDRENIFKGINQYERFYPWQTDAIVLRPEHPLGDCANNKFPSTCNAGKPHCITQIKPEEIVSAFDEMVHFMKHSGIKRISCPPIIKTIDQVTPLNFGFEL